MSAEEGPAAAVGIMALLAAFFIPILILVAVFIIAQWKIYSKAGQPGWAALIPFYSTIVLLEVQRRPVWWIALWLITGVPIIGIGSFIVMWVVMGLDLAKQFGKGAGFAAGLIFPLTAPIFLLILAFGGAQYQGAPAASVPPAPAAPLWIWPNLLSLDAPLVALAWFWMFKQVWLVKYHQPSLPWFLALTVWCIYVADRLMDERLAELGTGRTTARHRFHRQLPNPMKIPLLIGSLGVFFLMAIQSRGLLLYGMPVLLPVAAYFAVSFYDAGRGVSWFKNILAGTAFAYGTTVGVHFRRERSIWDLALSPEVVVFAGLCMINMIAIDHWEASSGDDEEEETSEFHKTVLLILLLVLVGACYWLALRAEDFTLQTHKAFYLSVMVGAGCLAFLALLRHLFSSESLRVLADVAMLVPLPFFYWLLVDYGIIEFGKLGWNLNQPDSAVAEITGGG